MSTFFLRLRPRLTNGRPGVDMLVNPALVERIARNRDGAQLRFVNGDILDVAESVEDIEAMLVVVSAIPTAKAVA